MNEVTCLINNSSKARGNTPRPREPRGQAGERRGRWVLGVGAGGWRSSAVLGESLHRTQDGAQPQQGSGWGSHSAPGCSVGAGPRCRSQRRGGTAGAGTGARQDPDLWEEATRSLRSPPRPRGDPPAPSCCHQLPRGRGKGAFVPWEQRAGAGGAGRKGSRPRDYSGKKRCSVSPANVLIPFNSPAAPWPWTRPQGHQPSPCAQGSSQPPSWSCFGGRRAKEPKMLEKNILKPFCHLLCFQRN